MAFGYHEISVYIKKWLDKETCNLYNGYVYQSKYKKRCVASCAGTDKALRHNGECES